jgi:hypothetical protein
MSEHGEFFGSGPICIDDLFTLYHIWSICQSYWAEFYSPPREMAVEATAAQRTDGGGRRSGARSERRSKRPARVIASVEGGDAAEAAGAHGSNQGGAGVGDGGLGEGALAAGEGEGDRRDDLARACCKQTVRKSA